LEHYEQYTHVLPSACVIQKQI